MSINIIKEPNVNVTQDDLARYRADYERDYMFYSGTPPTFESYIRQRTTPKAYGLSTPNTSKDESHE